MNQIKYWLSIDIFPLPVTPCLKPFLLNLNKKKNVMNEQMRKEKISKQAISQSIPESLPHRTCPLTEHRADNHICLPFDLNVHLLQGRI